MCLCHDQGRDLDEIIAIYEHDIVLLRQIYRLLRIVGGRYEYAPVSSMMNRLHPNELLDSR